MRKAPRWLPSALLAILAAVSYGQGLDTAAAQAADHKAKAFLDQTPGLKVSPTRVLVRFKSGTGENDKAQARGLVRATLVHQFRLVNGLEVIDSSNGASSAITALRHNPHVQYAELDRVDHTMTTPNDPKMVNQWGLSSPNGFGIDAPQAWSITTGDPNFVIADIDTGMQLDHLDLAANLYHNTAEIAGNGIDDDGDGYVDDVNGWNFYDNTNDPSDIHGHGTHTAGIMGAVGNNGIGITGVNWACKIMPLKFIGPNGGYDSDAIRAIEYAVSKGVKVSNNSWGGDAYDQALSDAIGAAGGSGHIFVAAAGNSSANSDTTPMYPAAYPNANIISVAAIDSTGNLAYFSNYGATSVDIAAPGDTIYSTYIGNTLTYLSGTSMAAPHVTGVIALLWGYHPDWTWQQVRDRILTHGRAMSSLSGKCASGSVVDAYTALSDQPLPPGVAITSPSNGALLTMGQAVTFSASASDGVDPNIGPNVQWSSDKQGSLGVGASLSVSTLQPGGHTITASVTDSRGMTATSRISVWVDNTAPAITIGSPANGASLKAGASVTFLGSATDAQDGNISSKMVWNSSIQGQLGSGASFSRSDLFAGTHTITVTVVDSGNLQTSTSFTISVSANGNTAPVVTIASPSSGTGFNLGALITFTGLASDTQDGNLGNTMSWTSNIMGFLGSGTTVNRSDLAAGTHTITASVTDSGGLTTSTTITVNVINGNGTTPMGPSSASVAKSGGSLVVTWSDLSFNETGFEIQRQSKSGKNWSAPVTVGTAGMNATKFTDHPSSGTWRYSVRAVNGAGPSGWSSWSNSVKF